MEANLGPVYRTGKNSFFRLVTLKIPGIVGGNKQTSFEFPDIGDLRYARTTALECYFANDLAYSMPEQIAVIPDNQANLLTLILNSNDPDKDAKQQGDDGRFNTTLDSQRWLPAVSIHRVQNIAAGSASFTRELQTFKDLYIVWDKSSLNVGGANGLNNTTDLAFVLGVYYTFINKKGVAYKRT